MLGKLFGKREQICEVGRALVFGNDEDLPGYTNGEMFANFGTVENAAKALNLTPKQVEAMREYGYIEVDNPDFGGTVYLEAGYGF